MPRSTKDSDDDVEPKPATGRMQTRMLTVQSVVNSPLRRSSRIKQNKYSPGSESDSSISSNQTTRSTRTRTATMDSTVSDTMKKLRTRKHSISSEISDMDVDIQRTPGKRITRQSLGTANLVSTSPRVNTRAASKRFMRAGSETQSPLPTSRTTRKTRASSIDPESLFDQNKSQSGSPIKTRMRASISGSQIKEHIELEDRIPYVRLDSTIVETDEITSSGNSDSSPDKALRFSQKINRKRLSTDKDEVEDYSHAKVETLIDSSKSDEPLQEKKDEIQTENMDEVTVKNIDNIVDKGSCRFEKTPSDNATIEELSTYFSSSPNRRNSLKEDKIKIAKENLDIKVPLINICESTKELEMLPENLSDTSIEEQKSNKENQILNIISDVSVEKSTSPKVTSAKSLTSPLMNKSLSEKETKSMSEELNLSKRRHSRESTEIAIKHSNLSKETVDDLQEKMDISIESLNSIATNDTILLHDNVELDNVEVDKAINKHETSIENTSTSSYNEDATKVIGESDKINKECIVTDSKNSNKIDSNEVNKTCSSMSLAKSTQINDSRESLISILTTDDNNEIKLILEERSPRRDENEISSNVAYSKSDQSIDLQINESSNDSATLMDKQSALTQDKVVDNSGSIEQEQNLSKHVTELVSESFNTVLETNNSTHDDSNDAVIQENQFSDLVETFRKSISPEKTDAKNILSEKIVKQNLKRKSTDVLDNLGEEKESLQMETSQKDQENMEIADDVSDVNAGIDLFQDIPADKWEEKNDTSSVPSTSQSMGEVENKNEAEAECDLILVDKRAWLAAETIKAAKEAESFEYDSDDTVLLKSRLDASQANCDIEKLATIDEKLLMDIDSEGNKKRIKKRKSRTKRRFVSEIDQDSSRYTEDEDNFTDKSLNESTTALNQTNDRSISILNKSEQSVKTRRRSSKASNEEEIEDESTNELNRSSLISKNNISLRKSMGGRTSLNKSSKDTSIQNMSVNKSRIDNSEEEFDDTDAHTGKKLYEKKRSLNKSCNESADDNANESEESKKNVLIEDSNKKKNISLNRSMDQKSKPIATEMIHLNDDESNNSDISITAMDFESKTYSLIANMGSTNSDQDSDQDECNIPSYLFAKANSDSDTEDNSSNSDINREYNLDGVDPKFSDDSVAADECRTSEVEFSDSDDNGSDLADFIVNDDEIEDEEEDNDEDDDDEDNDEDNDKEEDEDNDKEEDENIQNIKDDEAAQKEKMEDEEKQAHIDTELINMENKNENEDVKEKDALNKKEDANKNKFGELEAISSYAITSHKLPKIHKSKNKSIEYISPRKSETETKQSIKMKANMKKSEEPILLNSSNLDLSIKNKNKSLVKENETIVSDTSNLISSPLKMKTLLTKTKLDSQYSSRDEAEQNSSEQLNEFKSTSTKKLSKSCVLMECSTPNLNSSKKLELETFEKTPNKDIKSNNTNKATQNTSIKKNKSKKDLILNEDINLEKFSDANKEKMSNSNFSPDLLELLEKTSLLKSTSKTELRRTMNINIETPTLKYLRKEKLNESAPTLKSSTETTSLQKKLSGKNTTQIKLKEKNKEISDLSSDDVIQKLCQKKQKKRKRQKSANESITDQTSQDGIELNVPKKKKAKLTQLTIEEDNIRKDVCQTNKRRKKNKKQNTSKENIIDEVLSEDAIKLNIPKKKKLAKSIQLTTVKDNTRKDTCQISEKKKKKKKQDTSKENITDKALSEDAIELNVHKKKKHAKPTQLLIVESNIHEDVCQLNEKNKKKKIILSSDDAIQKLSQKKQKKHKKQEISNESITNKISQDGIQLNVPKKKKAKLTQLTIEEDNIREDTCQISEKKKKQDTSKKNTIDEALFEDLIELNIPKKKKHIKSTQLTIKDNIRKGACHISEKKKKQDASKENIVDKALSEDVIELNILKKKKHAKLTQLPIVENNTREDVCQIDKKKKKTKKQGTLKESITNKTLLEDAVDLKILKKKKRANLDQLATIQDNTREDACQVNEKKKKKKKQINVENTNINEDNMLRKNIRGNKTESAQHKKTNKIINNLKLDSLTDKQEKQRKKKIKQQNLVENIESLWIEKKNTLPVQIPVSKLKSEKNALPHKLQKTTLCMNEPKNVDHSTKTVEVDKVVRSARMCIPKELQPKKKRNRTENIENTMHVNVPTKKSKKIEKMSKFLPSGGLKRLSDDVIENLADMPMRAKKRRKVSRNEEKIVSSVMGKSKTTADRDGSLPSTSGSTVKFHIVNLQDTKKPSMKGATTVASFRQRMLARNNRESISAYMMYREKMSHAK